MIHDYECPLKREYQISEIIKWIDQTKIAKTHEFLLGDFNCYPESSLYAFLRGQQSLNQVSTKLGWFDLALAYSNYYKAPLKPTLDFHHNPRWLGENVNHMEIPARFDWVVLKNCYPLPYPKLRNVHLLGDEPEQETNIIPSDHYGILVDILL